jgi:hypothetical protein
MSFPANGQIHPSMVYTCTKKEVQEFIDRSGSWILFNGQMYDLKTRKIFEDRYEATFVKRKGY